MLTSNGMWFGPFLMSCSLIEANESLRGRVGRVHRGQPYLPFLRLSASPPYPTQSLNVPFETPQFLSRSRFTKSADFLFVGRQSGLSIMVLDEWSVFKWYRALGWAIVMCFGQDTLRSQCLSNQGWRWWVRGGEGKLPKSSTPPSGSSNTSRCYWNRDKFRQCGPLRPECGLHIYILI